MEHSQAKRKILISNPSSTLITFLPYIHSVLKVYAEKSEDVRSNFEWLEPIFLCGSPSELLANYELSSIDVLGLSCYVWNFPVQLEIARLVKQANPNCLVVAGGPEPDWGDADFFDKFPQIDCVVTHDGEIAFQRILIESLRNSAADYSNLPGVITTKEGRYHRGPPAEKIKEFQDDSPYCDDPQMAQILEKHGRAGSLSAIWETNRGCPYSCVFCDWGSSVNSRIRAVPQGRIEREARWFAERGLGRVYIADANFGILPRDEVITDLLCEMRRGLGWPKIVDWCAAKNNVDRVTRIARKLSDAELNRGVLIGYQSLNENVLKTMSRVNLGRDKHKQMVDDLRSDGVNLFAAVIWGSPDEDVNSFRDSLHGLIEMGYHSSIRCYLYALLPNAEASSPTYLSRYSIRAKRAKLATPVTRIDQLDSPFFPRINYVISHNKMNEEEWVEGWTYYVFLAALHNLGLTRYISQALHNLSGLSYGEFYVGLFESLSGSPTVVGRLLDSLREHLRNFLKSDDVDFFFRDEKQGRLFEHEAWFVIRCLEEEEAFWSELKAVLAEKVPDSMVLNDLLSFQAFCLHPISAPRQSTITVNYNWMDLLKEERTDRAGASLEAGQFLVAIDPAQRKIEDALWKSAHHLRASIYRQNVLGSMIYKDTQACIPLDAVQFSEVRKGPHLLAQ